MNNINKVIEKMGLRIESKFIPFSQSRNKNEKSPSLNWRVTLYQNDKEILITDYSAGCGHCPSYKQNDKSIYQKECIDFECEEGYKAKATFSENYFMPDKKKPILPYQRDVLYSLVMDSDAVKYDFSEWADNFGYETDSRKAEKIYNECLEIGLKILRVLGTDKLRELKEVYQDY